MVLPILIDCANAECPENGRIGAVEKIGTSEKKTHHLRTRLSRIMESPFSRKPTIGNHIIPSHQHRQPRAIVFDSARAPANVSVQTIQEELAMNVLITGAGLIGSNAARHTVDA